MKIFPRSNKILLLTFFILLHVACEKEPEFNVLTGQLIGYVSLYDSTHDLSDNSGVEVIFEGSNPEITTLTDEDGRFIVDNLTCGIYNIVFNKEGYCQHKMISYQFVGGNKTAIIRQAFLYCLPDFDLDSLDISEIGTPPKTALKVRAKVSKQIENSYSFCRYYLSNEPDVSFEHYVSTDVALVVSGYDDLSFYLPIDTLLFPLGSELYLIMYPASEVYQYYIDINSGNKIYTSLNANKPSEVVNITIPEGGVSGPPFWIKK